MTCFKYSGHPSASFRVTFPFFNLNIGIGMHVDVTIISLLLITDVDDGISVAFGLSRKGGTRHAYFLMVFSAPRGVI